MTQSPTVHRGRAGISIVEILITIVVLAVGALAALGLQVSALRASGNAESLQTLTRVADSELQFRRGIDDGGASLANAGTCRVFVPESVTCAVAVTPCTLVSGALSCTGVAAADATAHRVEVTTTGTRGSDVVLTSLVATTTRAAGSGATGNGGTGGAGGDNGTLVGGGDGYDSSNPVACVPRGKSGKCK